jgi:hypothetical protein
MSLPNAQHADSAPSQEKRLEDNPLHLRSGGNCARISTQRPAPRTLFIPLYFPPQRGGLRNLSGGAVCIAAENRTVIRTLIHGPTN